MSYVSLNMVQGETCYCLTCASTSMQEDITIHVIDGMCEEKMDDIVSKIVQECLELSQDHKST